jgi:hypothetical protein
VQSTEVPGRRGRNREAKRGNEEGREDEDRAYVRERTVWLVIRESERERWEARAREMLRDRA